MDVEIASVFIDPPPPPGVMVITWMIKITVSRPRVSKASTRALMTIVRISHGPLSRNLRISKNGDDE